MNGIGAIGMISYMNNLSSAYQGKELSNETKAKLRALGVSTNGIRTEAEGKMRLQEATLERSSGIQQNQKESENVDGVLLEARKIADELNIGYSENDSAADIINNIKSKVEELMSNAGEDYNKKSDAQYYNGKLGELERMQRSQIDLSTTLNLTASMNIAYFGLQ